LVVLSKLDTSNRARSEEIKQDYQEAGYTFISTSTKTMEGMDELTQELVGETTVFAGQSGAGKTSLMNLLLPEKHLKTGTLGDKSKRGKHTTRHIELFDYKGGYLVDTPGFNRLYVPEMEESQLPQCFPEFVPYIDDCRFATCLHYKEPNCAVKEQVSNKLICQRRYDNYIQFLEEIKNKEKRYND
jgi:ribosome biogenesis GTPase